MIWFLLSSMAHASRNTPAVIPLSDDLFWVQHYDQFKVFAIAQAFAFSIWVAKTLFEWARKKEDKTQEKLDGILQALAHVQEDVRNLKFTTISKEDAHELIEDKIRYAKDLEERARRS